MEKHGFHFVLTRYNDGVITFIRCESVRNRTMKDITNARLITLKGVLFLLIGLLALVLILLEHFSWKTLVLLILAIWSFCRLYYFMFYVIEHYVDPGFKFSGVLSFIAYLLKQKSKNGR